MLRTVLSLFDGMSCGQIALIENGQSFERYYASEIDKKAIAQTQLNFPNTIQLGDVTRWREWDIDWSQVDLILAGSPCQGFSFCGKQLAFDDPRSKLFFEFVDILNHVKEYNLNVKFLLENVKMRLEFMSIITHTLNVYPIDLDAKLVSAQERFRYFWTDIRTKWNEDLGINVVDIPNPPDRKLFLKDIVEDNVPERLYINLSRISNLRENSKGVIMWGAGGQSSRARRLDRKSPTLTTRADTTLWVQDATGRIRKLTILEMQRLQNIPVWYNWGRLSETEAGTLLGNGWNVAVIQHILSYL